MCAKECTHWIIAIEARNKDTTPKSQEKDQMKN